MGFGQLSDKLHNRDHIDLLDLGEGFIAGQHHRRFHTQFAVGAAVRPAVGRRDDIVLDLQPYLHRVPAIAGHPGQPLRIVDYRISVVVEQKPDGSHRKYKSKGD